MTVLRVSLGGLRSPLPTAPLSRFAHGWLTLLTPILWLTDSYMLVVSLCLCL